MKKKVLSLVLALLMTASAASTVLADDVVAIAEEDTAVEAVAVEEVEEGPYDKAIEFLAAYDIYKGYSAEDPAAEKAVQRYQMALLVSRVATGWTNDADWMNGKDQWTNFTDIDVEPVNHYFGALSFAVQNGIIEGYGNGKFGPTDGIKYQDALTMVVRTLGYNTLEYPWGYIQKAVELELTDGITGISYQEELNRGTVAQIVYNALFAKTKEGNTLAAKNFGIEFGWEKVVITASNDNSFTKLGEKDATGVEENLVEFKLLNNDGTLGDDAYRALASDFELDYTKHEDDLAVGEAYYVLFEKDTKSNLAEIVAVEPLLVDVVENEGKTDDEGEEQAYAIKALLDEYKLVTKYTANSYLNVTASAKPELLVWDVNGGITVEEVDGHYIAIDWENGHIMAPEYDKDGKPVDVKGTSEGITEDDYIVRWYFNEKLGRYYEKQYDKDGELLGINYMDDEDFEDFYASLVKKSEHKYKGFTALESISDSAYATLELFDTDLTDDDFADRGLYESYKLGYFAKSTEKCNDCGKEYDTWTFSEVGTEEKSVGADVPAKELTIEKTCDHKKVGAWFVEGYTPAVDEDGEYVDSYVIYNYDSETGAIKVVKVIDGSDEDSYVDYGVVRAYNVKNETVTIGEDDLTITYDELAGNGFYKVNDNAANKVKYSAIFNKCFNQFVKYVVVDGELVHIELAGATANELIVVDSYAGLSSDGYIVINGYSTEDLEYARFRLGSIDGWKAGDAYYYIDDYKAGIEGKGDVYRVVSYDEEEDVYFVELISNSQNFVDDYASEYVKFSTDASEDSYMTKESKWKDGAFTKDEYVKMSSSDKYILVMRAQGGNYAGIRVFAGKLPANAWIEGDLVKAADGTYVFVNANWFNLDIAPYEAGIVVLFEDSRFEKASYNGEGEEDWYLLGAVEYEVRAFDLLTGKDDLTVYATNKNYDKGYAYYTQGNVLTEDNAEALFTADSIIFAVNNAFDSKTFVAGDIPFAKLAAMYDSEENDDDIAKNRVAVESFLIDDEKLEIDGSKKKLNKLDEIIYKVIEIEETSTRYSTKKFIGDINSDIKPDAKAETFNEFIKDGNYTDVKAFYIYNVEERDVVIYLVLNEDENEVTKVVDGKLTAECTTAVDDIKNNEAPITLYHVGAGVDVDAANHYGDVSDFVEATDDLTFAATEVNYKATTVDGDLTKIALSSLTLSLTGKWVENFEKAVGAEAGHGNDSFDVHYGDAYVPAADEKAEDTAKVYAEYYEIANSCADDAATYVKVGDKKVAVSAIKEIAYNCDCDLIKGFTITLADNSEFIEVGDAKVITIGIKGFGEYTFTIDVVEEGDVGVAKKDGNVVMNDDVLVLANFCWDNYADRIVKH